MILHVDETCSMTVRSSIIDWQVSLVRFTSSFTFEPGSAWLYYSPSFYQSGITARTVVCSSGDWRARTMYVSPRAWMCLHRQPHGQERCHEMSKLQSIRQKLSHRPGLVHDIAICVSDFNDNQFCTCRYAEPRLMLSGALSLSIVRSHICVARPGLLFFHSFGWPTTLACNAW